MMSLRATQSLVNADTAAEKTCQAVQSQTDCRIANNLLQQQLGLSSQVCLAQKQAANCAEFFNQHPNYKKQEMNCSPSDVCRMALRRTMAEGCERYGVQVKQEFLAAVSAAGTCAVTASCLEGGLGSILRFIADPVGKSLDAGAKLGKGVVSQIQADREKLNRLACLDPETQAQFSCYLVVHYGGAIMGLKAAGEAGVTAFVSRMNALDADLAGAKAASASLGSKAPSSYGNLIGKAIGYTDSQIPGGAGGPIRLGLIKGKYLRTVDIAESDLPYSNAIRPVAANATDDAALPQLSNVQQSNVVLASVQHSGSAGVVRIGSYKGRPVALKAYATTSLNIAKDNQLILEEARGVKLLSDIGVGPQFHGVYLDAGGRYNIVMDIVRGDFSGVQVTAQSFEDLKTIEQRMRSHGITTAHDLQVYRTPEGRLQVIDAFVTQGPRRVSNLARDFDSEYAQMLFEASPELGMAQVRAIYATDRARFQGILRYIRANQDSGVPVPDYLKPLLQNFPRPVETVH